MGADKATLDFGGMPLIERVWSRVAPLSERVVVVGGEARLDHRGVETIPDRYPGAGAIGGVATALAYAVSRSGPDAWLLCVACDMPFLEPRLLAHLAGLMAGFDVVVPRGRLGYEPLCALYRATCLEPLEREIGKGNLRIFDVFRAVRTKEVPEDDLRPMDPQLRSFVNVNRPDELKQAQSLL